MSLLQLRASRRLWLRREKYRHNKKMDAFRAGDKQGVTKWDALWRKARAERKRRDAEIAAKTAATATSAKGIEFLMREEGSIPYAYNDPKGFATFGVGHLLHLSPVTASDEHHWGSPSNPRKDLVIPTLRDDLKEFEQAVRMAVKPALKRHQFDALLSLAFNIGIGGFRTSTVVKRLNAGHFASAADAILMWNSAGLLSARRRRERTLFLTGKYR